MAVATIQRWTFRTVLLVLALAALPCLLLPQIAIVAAISIVGIPLAMLMALIPPVFLFPAVDMARRSRHRAISGAYPGGDHPAACQLWCSGQG